MKRLWLIACLIFINSTSSLAQDYRFHSIFIYNFTKYIQWPQSRESGDFIIGIMGNSEIKSELSRMAEIKKVDNVRNIVIKEYNDPALLSECHMLFVPSSQSNIFEQIKSSLDGKAVLIMTEEKGLAEKGSGINFINLDNKWKFELNRSALEEANLKVANELTRLAILI